MASAQLVIGGADVELGGAEALAEVLRLDELADVLLGIESEELDPALAGALLLVIGTEEEPVIEDVPVIEEEPEFEEEAEPEDDPLDEVLARPEVELPEPDPSPARGQAVGIGS